MIWVYALLHDYSFPLITRYLFSILLMNGQRTSSEAACKQAYCDGVGGMETKRDTILNSPKVSRAWTFNMQLYHLNVFVLVSSQCRVRCSW